MSVWQVKLCDPLTMRAIHQCFCDEAALYQVYIYIYLTEDTKVDQPMLATSKILTSFTCSDAHSQAVHLLLTSNDYKHLLIAFIEARYEYVQISHYYYE